MRALSLVLVLAPTVAVAAPLPADDPAPVPAPATAPGPSYRDRLEELQRRVDALKARYLDDRVKLDRLKRIVLDQGEFGVTRATIVHKNQMGQSFRLVKVAYQLDGRELLSRSDESGLLPSGRDLPIFDGPLEARAHTLSLTLVYQGHDPLFRYLERYRFTVQSSHNFTADNGRHTRLEVVGFERGNPFTTSMEERPAVDFRSSIDPRPSHP